jgi:hypothetical protein
MTRAALLPAGSDPFLNAYWLRHFESWASEVDELHIAVCGPLEPDVLAYTQALVDALPNATLHHLPKRTMHGSALTYLLGKTRADHVMLCEDDAYIRRPGVVADAFSRIESGEVDIVACPRDSFATDEVLGIARTRFGETATAFWPCFLFVSRANLEATDRHFAASLWAEGERVTELDHTCLTSNSGDTFVSASWQLRAAGLRVELRDNGRIVGPVPDHHDLPWFHVGSLSSGYGYNFLGDLTEKEHADEKYAYSVLREDGTKRMAWWQRAWDCWDGGIPAEHDRYEAGFRGFMADIDMAQADVDACRATFDPLVTWAER